MVDPGTPVTGGCLCRAVRYEAIGEPLEVGYCHCRSCRRHTGAPVVTYVTFTADKVRFTGHERSIYDSSPGVKRAFCIQCGTPLTWEDDHEAHGVVQFHIGTVDEPDALVPDRHWYHEERIAWFDVADNLPRYRGAGIQGEEPYRRGPTTKGPHGET